MSPLTLRITKEELKESRKEVDRMLSEANTKELLKEEEALTKLIAQLDGITEEKYKEHRKALVEAAQALLQKIGSVTKEGKPSQQ